ncbi:MAG TPA: hypothetical protein VN811_08545, partial [Thermoanaerobaculia bacterium]|nr:hypothetical protein [Thermoanaerobaculia bacterium]
MSPWLPDETALAKSRATSFPLIVAVLCLLAAASRPAGAAKTIRCPDGSQRLELDVGTLSLQYSGDSLSATISSIDILRGHLTVGPTSIHQIATATQLWNEYIKGLAAGYNSCAISRAELSEGLTKVYPRITSTAAELDKFRQALSEGRQVDDQRLQQRLDSYFKDLRRFIDISRSQILLERVQAGVTRLLVDFEELLRHLRQQNVLSAPVVVGGEISALAAAR